MTSTLTSPMVGFPARERRAGLGIVVALALAAFLLLGWVFGIGFLASDDTLYWDGAGGWLAHIPYVGATHWALRHTLVVPMALARGVFGDGMTALTLPVLLYGLGLIVVIGLWLGRVFGTAAAAAALTLVVTTPQLVLLSNTAYIDIVEIFFLVSGLALLHGAMQSGGVGRLLLSGMLLGAAMLSRETTAFAVVAIGLLFLAGFGMARWKYFLVGAGFLIPFGGESLALWALTGNPLYRLNISAHHDSGIDRWVDQGASVPLVHPVIDPIIMLLLNHNFALLFWIGVPLTVWLFRRGRLNASHRLMAVPVATVGVVWTVIAAGLWSQLPLTPRYYMFPSVLLAMLTGVALVRLWASRPRLAGLLGALLLMCNFLALSLDNRHLLWGEHELAAIAPTVPGVLHASPESVRRAGLLLEWRGATDKVTATPPAPGDLYFYDPTRAEDAAKPQPGWVVVQRIALPENFGQWLLQAVGVKHRIPGSIWTRLGPGHPPVTLYRVS